MKDRKNLFLILCLVIIGVFTLTIAYSALSTVLTIQGNAQVASANWNIYLDNARVTSGSATTNKPVIKTSSTLEFSTTLNMPGDYYEFVVDVVNDGDLDAMIGNVVKTPELSASQAKYLKYEVSYQNGESISKKQVLSKGAKMPIKVRIEYRKDLGNSDLPTSQVVLDLSLTLEYIQSDGSGSSVTNNGNVPVFANGNINEIGTIVTIGSEQFYTIGTEGDNVKLLAMYNITLDDNPVQSENSFATVFSSDSKKGFNYSDYHGSIVEEYVSKYAEKIRILGINVVESRLFTYEEATKEETFDCGYFYYLCSSKYPWIYSMSYWLDASSNDDIFVLFNDATLEMSNYGGNFSVRPVIVISKDYF